MKVRTLFKAAAGMFLVLPLGADPLAPETHKLENGDTVNIVKCYPGGKMRASCLSLDDGTLGSDWPFLEALRERGIPATFFLNSEHPQSKDAIAFPKQYDGFEVASHGANHRGLEGMTEDQVRHEIETDIHILGSAFNQPITGFAYPYGAVPKDAETLGKLEAQLRSCGLVYARWVGATNAFAPPEDFIHWVPDCGFMDSFEKFISLPATEKIRVRMCFTHSIDFARGRESFDRWLLILDQLASDQTIWNTTMRDYASYVTALRELKFDDTGISNPSSISVWISLNRHAIQIPAKSQESWDSLTNR